LSNGLANPDIDFGANLKNEQGAIDGEVVWSDVLNVVRDTEGVRKVDESLNGFLLNGVRQSIPLLPIEFPQLTTVSLFNSATGDAI